MDLRPYLRIERAMYSRLARGWGPLAAAIFAKVHDAVRERDFARAYEVASELDLKPWAEQNREWMKFNLLSAGVFGGTVAQDGGTPLLLGGRHDKLLDRASNVLVMYLDRDFTEHAYQYLIELIQQAVRGELVTKADTDVAEEKPRFLKEFQSFKDASEKKLQMVTSLHTSRLASWGFFGEAEMLGLVTYRLSAVLDGRTSDWCRMIDGYEFQVDRGYDHIERALSVEDPEQLKTVHPWPKQDAQSMAMWGELTTDELADLGYDVPPFHPHCRTMVVRVDQDIVGEEKLTPIEPSIDSEVWVDGDIPVPTGMEQPPQPVAPFTAAPAAFPAEDPHAEEAMPTSVLRDFFTALGLFMAQEQLLKMWQEEQLPPPDEVLSAATGIDPETLKTDKPLEGQQVFSLAPDKTLKISLQGTLGEGTETDLRQVYDPYNRILYTGAMDVQAPEEVAAGWVADTYKRSVETSKVLGGTALEVQTWGGNSAYAHAQMGFIPSGSDWLILRQQIADGLRRGDLTKPTTPGESQLLDAALQSYDPKAIWQVANLSLGPVYLANKTFTMRYTWDDEQARRKFEQVLL
jgi:hypothetical protein